MFLCKTYNIRKRIKARKMRKKFLGVLCIIIGAVLLTSAWILTHHILVGGEQEGLILTPHPLNVPLPLFIFLFFGGISLITVGVIVGVLWFRPIKKSRIIRQTPPQKPDSNHLEKG